jgi:serine O-acetyltransferase
MAADALSLYRAARWLHLRRVPALPALLQGAGRLLFRGELPVQAQLGEGCGVGYGGLGVVVAPGVRVGPCSFLAHQVTLGPDAAGRGVPTLGAYVFVGAGARVLGPVHVGDFAIIGANAVVEQDVPRGAVMAGVPARELRREQDPAAAFTRDTGMAVAPEFLLPPEEERTHAAARP